VVLFHGDRMKKVLKASTEATLCSETVKQEGNEMYAIISTGGKQYKVSVGDEIFIEKLEGEAGDSIKFDVVLAICDDNGIQTGAPTVEGVSVDGEIVKQGKQKKIIVFKYKAKKGYRRKKGHRQPYTRVRINKIVV
jgi:large subunit ribosomal protein L21